jgi:hypothetical protein
MIELKENDLAKIKIDRENTFIIIRDHYMNTILSYDVIAVWRYNEETGNYLKIYDKEELCQTVKPADVPYDKYISLEHENAELRNIIVELNKKLYGKDNKIH